VDLQIAEWQHVTYEGFLVTRGNMTHTAQCSTLRYSTPTRSTDLHNIMHMYNTIAIPIIGFARSYEEVYYVVAGVLWEMVGDDGVV
jgi:hypothetical protein